MLTRLATWALVVVVGCSVRCAALADEPKEATRGTIAAGTGSHTSSAEIDQISAEAAGQDSPNSPVPAEKAHAQDQPTDKPAAQPSKRLGEKPAEKPAEKTGQQSAPAPSAKPGENPRDKPVDKPADKPAGKPAEKPGEKPGEKAEEKPAAKPDAQPAEGPAAAEYKKLLAEFRQLIVELGVLREKYRVAAEDQRGQLRSQWDALIQKGEAMQPQLIAAAEKAFLEAPNADKELTDLLVALLSGHVSNDRYDEGFRLGKMLMDNKCADKRAADLAGRAAYAVDEFHLAEKYLQQAKEQQSLSDNGKRFLADIPERKAAWAKEQQIRQAEQKADDLPRVLIKTTKGDIEVELFENEAPNTVANFVSLVEKKFYDGLTFHRVLGGFMAQGGCPKGTGTGGPGYRIADECRQENARRHFRGSLSMANSGPDTNGSQFFITFLPTSFLDGKHTVFGRVIKGFDVLHKLQRRDPEKPDQPEPDKIIEARVLRKRDHEYKPVTLPE